MPYVHIADRRESPDPMYARVAWFEDKRGKTPMKKIRRSGSFNEIRTVAAEAYVSEQTRGSREGQVWIKLKVRRLGDVGGGASFA